jgi:hypothetical protein
MRCSLSRNGSFPGLGVVGCKDVDKDTRDEAIDLADSTTEALQTVDRFIALNAKAIEAMLLKEETENELNLTGLRNALDGVVDKPGRIVHHDDEITRNSWTRPRSHRAVSTRRSC